MELPEALLLEEDLANLARTQGSNAKKELSKRWKQPHHLEFLELVGNDKRQWFTTWDSVKETRISSGSDLGFDEILYMAENRLCTPAETNSRLRAKLDDGWPESVIKAIVNKTLDAGITAKSVLKANGQAVKTFAPALAADFRKMSEKIQVKTLRDRRYVATPKMDGLRCVFVLNQPNEGVYSKNMKPLKNLGKHLEALKTVFTEPCAIDGEALDAGNTWEGAISGAKRAGSNIAMHFYAFDYIPGEETVSNEYTMTSEQRYERLVEGMDQLSEDMFRIVIRSGVLRDPDSVWAEHDECVEEGWEGVVLHDLDAPYRIKKATRTRNWIKVKKFVDSEFLCVGFHIGTGKHSGRLGKIEVVGQYDGRSVSSRVGTGFSDKEREDIWNNQSKYLNLVATIKFQGLTPDDSLRFPSFLRWRMPE